jgi:hypothetical protein
MPRPTIAIDVRGAQSILDKIKADQFPNELSLCTFAAQEYNKIVGTPEINHQLIKLRINSGVLKLAFPMPKGKRGRQAGTPISDEQKHRMMEGRKNKEKKVASSRSTEWTNNMQEAFSGKATLLNGVLSGKMKACVKGMCIQCVGGYNNRTPDDPPIATAIRDCNGVSCPLYVIRPFQKKNQAEE